MKHLEIIPGYKYTQATDVAIKDRIVAEQLYMPDGQENNWKSITDAEAEVLNKQIEDYYLNLEKEMFPADSAKVQDSNTGE